MIGFCLAAGAGTRLAPLTRAVPKPLLAPAGRPLLELALAALDKAGVERVVVNAHHGAGAIAAWLQGRQGVRLAREPVLLGTGGGLVAARRAGMLGGRGGDEIVLVSSADHVVDPADLAVLAGAVQRTGAPVAMGVGAGEGSPRWRLRGDRVAPDPDGPLAAAGVFALRARVLDQIEPGYSTLLEAVLEPCWRRGSLLGVPMRGPWADAGTLGRFLDVSAGLLTGRWPYPLPPGRLLRGEREEVAGVAAAGPVLLVAGAVLEPGALVAGPVVLDAGSRVEAGALVTRAVVGPGATVARGATVSGSVLGPGARAEAGAIVAAALLPAGIG